MSDILFKPEILYHFTSPVGLAAIILSRHIDLTENNLNIHEANCGVVWLTSSPDPMNHGLKFDDTIPSEYDKTSIRITLTYKKSFKQWDAWSDGNRIDKGYKASLIASAGAEETYKTWYISESIIPIEDILKIENTVTGETISVEEAIKFLPESKTPEVKFRNEIDAYIAKQPGNLQVILLNVRMAIRQAAPAMEHFALRLAEYKTSKGAIQFPYKSFGAE